MLLKKGWDTSNNYCSGSLSILHKTKKQLFGRIIALFNCTDECASGSARVESPACQWDFLRTETEISFVKL